MRWLTFRGKLLWTLRSCLRFWVGFWEDFGHCSIVIKSDPQISISVAEKNRKIKSKSLSFLFYSQLIFCYRGLLCWLDSYRSVGDVMVAQIAQIAQMVFNLLLAIKFFRVSCTHDVQSSYLCEFTYKFGDFISKQVFKIKNEQFKF